MFHPSLPPWDPMTVKEGEIALNDALKLEAVTWIDARGAIAYQEGHIPEAILLNEDHWDEHFEKFIQAWDGASTLVVYCDSRTCATSKTVAQRLKVDLALENVFVLKGGWQTWLDSKK